MRIYHNQKIKMQTYSIKVLLILYTINLSLILLISIMILFNSAFRVNALYKKTNNIAFKFSSWPSFKQIKLEAPKTLVYVIHSQEASTKIPSKKLEQFKKDNKLIIEKQQVKEVYLSEKLWDHFDKKLNLSYSLEADSHVDFSQKFVSDFSSFSGYASWLLSTPYKFSRKQEEKGNVNISINDFANKKYVLELVQAMLRAKQWTNTRGDQANSEFFLKEAQRIYQKGVQKYGDKVKITIIKGNNLLDEGFRLMHAVGRASKNQSIFINLSYNGNPNTDQYQAFVGKGVCFDSGGLNLKPSTGIKQMHMDKHGAASVLSAFETVIDLGLPINITSSMGYVQNFINENSYRPLDIIKSRKGLTVQIGNTDAEGRLVLADCMNWTQQKFKCQNLIEFSTLTGAVIIALGKKHAGLFSNSDSLSQSLLETGNKIGQKLWRLPVDSYHRDIVTPKTADLSNSPGKSDAASSQAAAFLQSFVQKGVEWAHIDIAGTSNIDSDATGYGARLIIQHLKKLV